MARYTIDFSTNASYILQEIEKINAAIAKTARTGKSVQINIDTSRLSSEIDNTFRKLDRQISAMQTKLSNLKIGSRKFQERATGIGIAEGLRERGTMQAQSIRLGAQAEAFDIGSVTRLQKQLQAARIEASQIAPNTEPWLNLQRQIGQLKIDLRAADKLAENIQMQESLGAFAPGSLNALEAKLIILRNRAREISPDTTEWRQLNKEIVQAEQSVEKQSRKPLTRGQRFGAAGGAFLYGGGLGGGVGSAVGGIAGGLIGGVPGAFTGAAVGQLADNLGNALAGMTSQASAVQQMQRGLAMASVDAKDFAEAQSTVAAMSQKLLMPLEQTTRLFTQLRVNTKQYNLSVQDTAKIMEGTALAIAATGGNSEDLEGAMRAVVQIFSKGGVQAEELRGQLGERFPGAVVKFAQANKLSFEQLQEGLEQGKIGIKEFVAFAEKNYTDYSEFSKKLATAPEYAGKRLQIAFEALSRELGGLFAPLGANIQDALTVGIQGITKFVAENRVFIKQFISDWGTILGPIVNIFVQLLQVLAKFSLGVAKIFQGIFSGIRQSIGLANIGEAKARLDKAKAATVGKTRTLTYRGGTTTSQEFRELDAAQKAFNDLGGNAAYQQASQPLTPANLTYGGPGAGMSLERMGKGESGKTKKPNIYISTKSPEIEAELSQRLAAVEANASLNAREKEIRKANLTEFAKHAIAREELDARLLQIEKAGYANRQKAIDDANAAYQKSIGQATLEREKVLFGPILDAIESETKATALATIQQELYGDATEVNNDLLEAEYLIRTTLDALKGKDIKRGKELAQILRDQIKLRIQDANAAEYRKRLNEELLKPLQDEIALLRAVNDEERRRLEILQKYPNLQKSDLNKVMDLEKVRKNIKQVRELIDNFVISTSSDYKGFLKAVISGEDAVDALEQFQQGLKDRVLTIFLDFTMKPIEDFFKEVVGGNIIEKLFPKTEEEKKQEAAKAPIDANTEATKTNTTAIEKLTAAISGGGGTSTTGAGFSAYAQGAPSFLPMDSAIFDSAMSFASQKTSDKLNTFAYETTGFADNLNQTVDGIKGATDKAKQNGTGFLEGLGGVVQGIGMLAGSAMGIVAGIKQIEKGDTSSVISGIGSILTGIGGSILGFGKLFGANGGVAAGGWKPFPATAFASGGMVTGPTLGLVGEGKYNEAIVPLPDGRSIPVQLQDSGVRDKMGGGMGGGYASPMISMSFETTKIGGVEYVSRDQLELAMMETRRQAANDGAKRGMSMTLDRLQQSPQTRNRLGLR